MIDFPIDFVVTWVDGSDPIWIRQKNNFSEDAGTKKRSMNSEKAFREWGTFKYWFRGVEKFAPWVNRIFLVTNGQIPDFLNLALNEKLRLIKHSDIMQPEELPTFNSNAIEANLNKIPDLSEHFVVFNDDMYLTSPVLPKDFFTGDGLPVYTTGINPIIPTRYGTANFQVNNMEIINDYFTHDEIITNGHFFSLKHGLKNIVRSFLFSRSQFIYGFWESHMPYPLLKATMNLLWEKELDVLKRTSSNKFRSTSDTNIWLFKYWQIASGKYGIGDSKFGELFYLDNANEKLWNLINSGKYSVMCINDGMDIEDEDEVMVDFNNAMDKLLPNKSSFEK
ncbi:stealth family protein [Limosilactobacillus fermentum]|uniref:stealth family protein n=1 Tax=Limosilactobacillus fermentum TaxID=1613 RepID=UPI0020190E92|nr:stealth family protein [Limosilactobacillus fermentum]MCL3985711.1 stealth family protein [Limosilactobacillus fermentum]